jgi:predicted metal-dependent phosphoesterase TrpH
MHWTLLIDNLYLTITMHQPYHLTMLFDMHVHTRFSPCSNIRIRQIIKRAREVGLDGFCITDHDTVASKREFEKIADTDGICVIIGTEYTTPKGDILIYGPVDNLPQWLGAEQLFAWVRKEGGIAVPAHPFRKERPANQHILHSANIIESMNGRNRPAENEMCRKWLREQGNGKREIGGSDAHTLEELGKIVTVFEKDITDSETLIHELKHGKYYPLQRDSFQRK